MLETLSRLLPDNVWLSEVTLDGNELAFSGMAEDASVLIPLVEKAPEFEQARFHAPSTRMTVRNIDGSEREVERHEAERVVLMVTHEPVMRAQAACSRASKVWARKAGSASPPSKCIR